MQVLYTTTTLKTETWRVRLIVWADRLPYHEDIYKVTRLRFYGDVFLVNSVMYNAHKGAIFLSCDLEDFFLVSPMEQDEYTSVSLKYLPTDIQQKCGLQSKVHLDEYVYININGMYGLNQETIIAYQ